MDSKLYSISCDPKCGFMVRSHDEEEALHLAMEHSSNKHKELNVTMDQLKAMVKSE